MRVSIRIATAVLTLLPAAFIGGASAAFAAEEGEPGSNYCGLFLDTGASACFETPAELRLWQERQAGGPISQIPTESTNKPSAVASQFLLGRFYESANFSGAYKDITGSGACNTNKSNSEYQLGYVGSVWNDRISSFRGYSNCAPRLYESLNFGGSAYGPTARAPTSGRQ